MKDIGNQRFSDSKVNANAGTLRYKDKVSEDAFSYFIPLFKCCSGWII